MNRGVVSSQLKCKNSMDRVICIQRIEKILAAATITTAAGLECIVCPTPVLIVKLRRPQVS